MSPIFVYLGEMSGFEPREMGLQLATLTTKPPISTNLATHLNLSRHLFFDHIPLDQKSEQRANKAPLFTV